MPKIRQIVWEGIGKLKELDNAYSSLKYDGAQYLLHIKNGKAYAMTSKRISTKTGVLNEKIDHFDWLKNRTFNEYKKETILVTEVVCEHLKDINRHSRNDFVSGTMNTKLENLKENNLSIIVHDAIIINGKDYTKEPYSKIYSIITNSFPYAGKFGENIKPKEIYSITCSPTKSNNMCKAFFNDAVELNFEGSIIRDFSGNGSAKMKRINTCDCVITGFKSGTGKYAENGWIGSVEVSLFSAVKLKKYGVTFNTRKLSSLQVIQMKKDRAILPVGFVSGFNEDIRKQISENKSEYVGKIMECEYMQKTVNNKLKNPRYLRFRNDKQMHRCTVKQLD